MGHVFVDVSNVASLRKEQQGALPWFDVLLVCDAWLDDHPNDAMTLVVDWGFHGYLQYNFPSQFQPYVRARDAKTVRLPRSRRIVSLIEAPEGVAADEFLLSRANKRPDRAIIAEDRYRPYRDDYPWLQGFELQKPVFDQNNVEFASIYLHPLDEDQIDDAEEADEEHRAQLQERRDSRRNRHQRRAAARRAPVSIRPPASRPPAEPATDPERVMAFAEPTRTPRPPRSRATRGKAEVPQRLGWTYWAVLAVLIVAGAAIAYLKFG